MVKINILFDVLVFSVLLRSVPTYSTLTPPKSEDTNTTEEAGKLTPCYSDTHVINFRFHKMTVNSYNKHCYIFYSTLIKTVYYLWLVLSRDLCPPHYLNPSSW